MKIGENQHITTQENLKNEEAAREQDLETRTRGDGLFPDAAVGGGTPQEARAASPVLSDEGEAICHGRRQQHESSCEDNKLAR